MFVSEEFRKRVLCSPVLFKFLSEAEFHIYEALRENLCVISQSRFKLQQNCGKQKAAQERGSSGFQWNYDSFFWAKNPPS